MKLISGKGSFLFLAVVANWAASARQSDWTTDEIDDVKTILYDFFAETETGEERRAPGALRLAFHDCVGGCDGCVNLKNPDNFGLESIVQELEVLYATVFPFGPGSKTMSKADFYNLAGIVAVEYSIDWNNRVCSSPPSCLMSQVDITFAMGRVDCPTSPDTDDDRPLPGGFFDHRQLMDFWDAEFGMDPREATAILGGHTLGGFEKNNSGYTGDWKEGENDTFSFNNQYYSLLLDPKLRWEHFDAAAEEDVDKAKDSDERWMWKGIDTEGTEKSFMINVDVDLIMEVETTDEGGYSSCNFETCRPSATREIVELYSQDANLWLRDFVCAFEKMTQAKGPFGGLVKPRATEEPRKKKSAAVSCNI